MSKSFWTCQSFGLILKILSVRTIKYAAEILIFCQSEWNFVGQILRSDTFRHHCDCGSLHYDVIRALWQQIIVMPCCRNTPEFCQTSFWQNSRFCRTEHIFVGPNFFIKPIVIILFCLSAYTGQLPQLQHTGGRINPDHASSTTYLYDHNSLKWDDLKLWPAASLNT